MKIKISIALSVKLDIIKQQLMIRGHGGIGRRNGLKIRWEKSRVGSSPTVPTITS